MLFITLGHASNAVASSDPCESNPNDPKCQLQHLRNGDTTVEGSRLRAINLALFRDANVQIAILTNTRRPDDKRGETLLTNAGASPGTRGVSKTSSCAVQGNDVNKADPINIGSGNESIVETDFQLPGEMGLALERTYVYLNGASGIFGPHWRSNYDYRLLYAFGPDAYECPHEAPCDMAEANLLAAERPDGSRVMFVRAADGNFYEDKPTPISKIVPQGATFVLYWEDGSREVYSNQGDQGTTGRLLKKSDQHGVSWTFAYTGRQLNRVTHSSGQYVELIWTGEYLTGIRDPAGHTYTYGYTNVFQNWKVLGSVTAPGDPAITTTYHYEAFDPTSPYANDLRYALTGKSINGARYSRIYYDPQTFLAIGSERNGAEKYSYAYSTDADGRWIAEETNPLGKKATYVFTDGKLTSVTGTPSANCPFSDATERTYDTNGYPLTLKDARGYITQFVYSPAGQLLRKTEASGTSEQRVTEYTWKNGTDIESETIVGKVKVIFSYGADGRLSKVERINLSANGVPGQSRITTYTYTYQVPVGGTGEQVLESITSDGPLPGTGDVETVRYDTFGNIVSVTNSLGHTTAYSNFDGLGRAGHFVGPNGDVVDAIYDVVGRAHKTIHYVNGAPQTTIFDYDALGRLSKTTLPNGRALVQEYDNAWRVTRKYAQEAAGTYEVTRYTYNPMSQVTSTVVERVSAVAAPTAAPTASAPSSSADGNYSVSWSAVSTASEYQLDESANGGGWASIGRVKSTTQGFTSKADGTYSYRVTACNQYGCASPSNTVSVQVVRPPSATPTLTAPAMSASNTYSMSWTAVASATSYKVEENTGNGLWTALSPTASTSMTLTGRGVGTYSYRVSGCNVSGCGPVSAVVSVKRVDAPISAPSLSAPSSSPDGNYTLSWTGVSAANAYQLDESSNSGAWASVGRYAGTTFTYSAKPDGTYAYRVWACNEAGCTGASNTATVQVIRPPAASPALSVPATSSSSTYTITWTAVGSASSYNVEENTGNGLWTTLAPTASTWMTLTGRGQGTYSYRVAGCNVSGCGPVSAVGSVNRLDLPGSPTVSAPAVNTNGSYTVSWSGVSGATAYQLDESVNGGAWTTVSGGNSVALTGRSTAASYSYRAWACNAAGCGAPSATVTVQPIVYGSNYVNQAVPTLVAAGRPFAATVQFSNTGNTTWTAADAYSMGSLNPGDNTTWGTNRIGTPSPVAPGQVATYAFNATAPSAAGTYNFQWRMVRDGYAWFGATTPNVVITVASGSISASTNPCKIYVGETTCTVTMSWSSSRADAEVWVSNPDGSGPQLFARAQGGTQVANWITTNPVRFAVKSGGVELSAILVSGYQSGEYRPDPNPPKCPTRQCQVQ
ncbi:DUF6531 domain-containing protein [Lysobacter claricitrinus]|uniref:DUF6531 domain-containing protein n=1 Tax=Lysobacter claricitrinus TaxID=3367728 RepID=UPI0038B2DE53